MQFIGSCHTPSSSPDVVDTSMRVLQTYAMTQSDSLYRDAEARLIDAAAECVRDYVMGIGRFGAPPSEPAQQIPEMMTQVQLATYLDNIVRMGNHQQR